MAEFTEHPPGNPSWVDLMSNDLDGAKTFYSNLFGWDLTDEYDDDGNRIYVTARLDGKQVAGLGSVPPGMEMPSVWNTYISTADINETVGAATGAGGSVVMPPMQVMEAGTMAVLADPTGAAFSVWQPGQHIGVELGNVPNTYSWNELMTRDVDTAKSFYGDVFGWQYDTQQMPNGQYNVISGGEHGGLGGIIAMPGEVPEMVPNHWGVYFTVADLDESVSAVTKNGGQVVMPPMELGGIGHMATVHDNSNASFNLLQPAQH